MGLAPGVEQIHEVLNEFEIEHQFEFYNDPKASLTTHILGIGYHIIPAMRFCLPIRMKQQIFFRCFLLRAAMIEM
ncbi:MAG: hypothetical protein ACFFE5_16700 [Candidatus Thorarchaeota archaeon]